MTTYELMARYDARQSFYGKAKVIVLKNGDQALRSYDTIVALIKDGQPIIRDLYSPTTTRHQKEFLKQNGFYVETRKDLEKLFPSSDKEFKEFIEIERQI